MSENKGEAIRLLVEARSALNKIRSEKLLEYEGIECDSCSRVSMEPRKNWTASVAVDSAWNKVNNALRSFGAQHLMTWDFKENEATGSPVTRDLEVGATPVPPETEMENLIASLREGGS